jgi:hypothetical protein
MARNADIGEPIEELLDALRLSLLEASEHQQRVALQHTRQEQAGGVLGESVRREDRRLVIELPEGDEDLISVPRAVEAPAGEVDLKEVVQAGSVQSDRAASFPIRVASNTAATPARNRARHPRRRELLHER